MQIEFQGVDFSFPGKPPVLQDISLHIPSGSSLGLIGPSGCGKTTLAQLVPRFYDPAAGRILINGKPLIGEEPMKLRQRMGYISQASFIMTGSVRENLTFGNNQGDNRLIDLLEQLRPGFIETLPHGLETQVGEGGVRLSGGEKQTIAIARELLKPIEFILIDEATASLDNEKQLIAQQAIDAILKQGVTVIMIAHRLSTTRNCDQMCVLRELIRCPEGMPQIEALVSTAKGDLWDQLWNISPYFKRNAKLEGISF